MITDEQRRASVDAVGRALRLFHTQSNFAAQIGKSQSHVSRLVAGEVVIDAYDAIQIEQRTHGKIARYQLRPDLWEGPNRKFADTPRRMLDKVIEGRAIDALKTGGTPFDGEHVVGAVLGDHSRPTKGKHYGKTRTGKREGARQSAKETDGRRPAAQGRQGRKAQGRKGKG